MSDMYRNAIGKEFGRVACEFDANIISKLNAKLGSTLQTRDMCLMITENEDTELTGDPICVNTTLSHIDGALVRIYVQSDEIPELKDNPYIDVDDFMYDQFSNVVMGIHLFDQCDVEPDVLNPAFIERREHRGKL